MYPDIIFPISIQFQTIISPDDLANGRHTKSTQTQLELLLSMLKHEFERQIKGKDQNSPLWKQESLERVAQTCVARGSGLLAGIVNRRSKFNIFVQPEHMMNIEVEIIGPNKEFCYETIHTYLSWHDQTGGVSLVNGHTANETYSDDENKIPCEYQCLSEGQILLSYIPRTKGIYKVSIRWQGVHINDSPFVVKVAEDKMADTLRYSYSYPPSNRPEHKSVVAARNIDTPRSLSPTGSRISRHRSSIGTLGKQATVTR